MPRGIGYGYGYGYGYGKDGYTDERRRANGVAEPAEMPISEAPVTAFVGSKRMRLPRSKPVKENP